MLLANILTMPDAIALFGVFGFLTATVLKLVPAKNGNGYVKREDFTRLEERMVHLQKDIDELKQLVKRR